MNIDTSIFKAYDIRGVYPSQINTEVVYKIAQAYVKFLSESEGARVKPARTVDQGGDQGLTIVVGHDMRLSGEEFTEAVIRGLTEAGVNVVDLGLVSTDMLYYAAATLDVDGGIQITASHNPKEYGGLKLVGKKGKPISGDTGIYQIRDLVNANSKLQITNSKSGTVIQKDIKEEYFEFVISNFDTSKFKNFKIVANTNFGMGNLSVEYLKKYFPKTNFVKVVYEGLDGNFPLPLGRPDPLIPENRAEIIAALKEHGADLGVAWDADADRCFFFDENGDFVTPAYVNALVSEYYLQKFPGGKIVHDTRVVRVIDYMVEKNGGVPVQTKAGHSFIKERMIKEGAVFGSETSGHYYFKDTFYLDNGLFPLFIVLDILSSTGEGVKFSEILKTLREKFFISEEMNFKVANLAAALSAFKQKYSDSKIEEIDGLSFNYPNWRFNVRKSNTESLLRINVEANAKELLEDKIKEVVELVKK
ncbi:MAG: phosphomannomutase/phosphoglucomutase [Candidatus Doudnabacteria bacterium]|nr:phosphomannomutase/phosphoglucomutase [Candidatus Doudnabacteria bacterium]